MDQHGHSNPKDAESTQSSDEATKFPAQFLSPSNFTHPSILSNDHIDSFQVFIDDVNCALAGALSRNGSVYRNVAVLFLRWEDDVFVDPGVNNGVQGEIDNLEQIFKHDYGFETDLYLIPSQNSQRCLQRKIFLLQEKHDSRDELLVVYYGGHGVLNDLNQSIWAQGHGPTVDWFSIQHLLEYAVPDIIILLDCCYAASADQRSVDGTMEILAACGREVGTVGISDWSFTSRLTELLHNLRDQSFTVVQLHSKLMNYRAADGPKKLLRTPHHGIMSNKDKASIRLSSMASTRDLTVLDNTELAISEETGAASSRVLIAVSLQRNNLDPGAWRDWLLSHLPGGINGLSLVRPEGIWGAYSVLGLFSLPAAVWDLLPNKFAYTFVGFVTTPNMIRTSIGSADMASIDLVTQALTGPHMRSFESQRAKDRPSSSKIPAVTTIKSDDIVLAVMGATGAGKSSFIANASGSYMKIGHTLESDTEKVEIASFQYEGRSVHLVETPGFDDTLRSDADVLKDIAYWLSYAYVSNVQLSGIIYLHPINSDRMFRSALKTLRVMRAAWGASTLSSVALVTSMWDSVEPALGASRELELMSTSWQPLMERGSFSSRYENSRDSALSIISAFMTGKKITLDIQHEMVDQHMRLGKTAAGQQLQAELDPVSVKERLLAKEHLDTATIEAHTDVLKARVELKAALKARVELKAALNIRAEQLAASKDQDFQEELVKLQQVQRQYDLDQAHYTARVESLHNLIGSKRNLQQALGVGAAVTTSAATALCIVM